MKRKVLIFAVSIALLIGFGYFSFNGNPIEKEKSKEIVSEYLEEKYPEQTFTIDHVGYYPGEGTYIVHFVSEDGKLQGNIDVRDGRIAGDEFKEQSGG